MMPAKESDMTHYVELPADQLRRTCDPASFEFETTESLPLLDEILGQPRAVAALELGTSIASHGFNLFAMGLPGSGKTTLLRGYLEKRAMDQPVPPDLCYVYNFSDARRPLPLRLPPGMASGLMQDCDLLVEELKRDLARAFDSAEYVSHRDEYTHAFEAQQAEAFKRLEHRVEDAGFRLLKGPGGLLMAPAVNGRPMQDEDLEALKPEERERIVQTRERLQRELESWIRGVRDMERAARESLKKLDSDTAGYAIAHLVDDLRSRYCGHPDVVAWLADLKEDVIAHADDFRKKETEGQASPLLAMLSSSGDRPLVRYQVNVLVDQRTWRGAPVVVESNPTYHNLTGRIEHQASYGEVHTDHTMIKPGALHRANGGYLIIPARECLLNPYAWEGLKRALKERALRVEELSTQFSLMSTVTLEPEPVPLDVKVVLIGSPSVYYLLFAYDEDFQKLFKVKAEFATRMERNAQSERAYAEFVRTMTNVEDMMPFDRGAVARIVEYGSRLAEDQARLTTRFGEIADLIREAAHCAGRNTHKAVTAQDVRFVEEQRRYRQNLMEERYLEMVSDGTLLLDVEGKAVGRVNGLSVIGAGDYAFGHPARITGTVGPGKRGVVSIEREVELSGPIHGKGVLILSGYLLRTFGQSGPLNLTASLVFEQSYGMVEGDSASLAELCVLLSALSEVPLRQDLAMTGSVNQHGEVQAIGGVTEKVEGFFEVCRRSGFSGTQGVLIPNSNRQHLMLREEVVDAVREGRFHIWTVTTLDEALELLTAGPAREVHTKTGLRLAGFAGLLRGPGKAHE
jgi:lon-related putative ATP-dependent protease